MKTKDKLVQALRDKGAPLWMIEKAFDGGYDDFESMEETPIVNLVRDCQENGLPDIEFMAINGDFDSTKEEADAWFEREGKKLLE